MEDFSNMTTVAKVLFLIGIVIVFIYKWISRETAFVGTAMDRLERKRIDNDLAPVDPELYPYLESRKLENNLQKDFTTNEDYTLNANSNAYTSKHYPWVISKFFHKTPFRFDGSFPIKMAANGKDYAIISTEPYVGKRFASSSQGVVVNLEHLLIYPFFHHIKYSYPFKVFICYTYLDVKNYKSGSLFNRYYFDCKGRYLGTDQASIGNELPAIGYMDDKVPQVIKIAPLPQGVHLIRIIHNKLFLVFKGGYSQGLINHTGKIILPLQYERVIVKPGGNYALLEKESKTYRFNLKVGRLEQLPYNNIRHYNDTVILVANVSPNPAEDFYEWNAEVALWGAIDMDGNEILKPEFDNIQLCNTPDRFRVFKGDYTWEWDKVGSHIFSKKLSFGHKPNEFHGMLNEGKWGLVDNEQKTIIPAKYDWIENLTNDLFLFNVGGSLYSWYCGDDKTDSAFFMGGLWGLCTKDGEILEEAIHERKYPLEQKYQPDKQLTPEDVNERSSYYADWKGSVVRLN